MSQICREGDRPTSSSKKSSRTWRSSTSAWKDRIGWAILECLTLDPKTHSIPLIVCSAAVRELQAHQEMLDRYGIDVLTKPFDLDLLLEKVATALIEASGDSSALRRGSIGGWQRPMDRYPTVTSTEGNLTRRTRGLRRERGAACGARRSR